MDTKQPRGSCTPVDTDRVLQEVCDLVDEARTTCLWYLRENYYPRTLEEAVRVLKAIERGGDVDTFKRAARLRAWLSQTSSEASAGS